MPSTRPVSRAPRPAGAVIGGDRAPGAREEGDRGPHERRRPLHHRAVPRRVAAARAAAGLGGDGGGPELDLLAPDLEEELRDLRVELRAGAGRDLDERMVDREHGPVGPRRGHRVERVGDGEEARLDRDRAAAQPRRVAVAVPALVMEEDVRERPWAERIGRTSSAPARGWLRIAPSSSSVSGPVLRRTLARDRDLADVVERRAEAERREPLGLPAEQLRDRLGERRDPGAVPEVLIALLERPEIARSMPEGVPRAAPIPLGGGAGCATPHPLPVQSRSSSAPAEVQSDEPSTSDRAMPPAAKMPYRAIASAAALPP